MVLNNKDGGRFTDETRQKVAEAAEKLNYRPAAYAQIMKGKHLPVIGLIIPDLMNHFYGEVTSGFSHQAYRAGYNVILMDLGNSPEREESFVETLIAMNVSGVGYCGIGNSSASGQAEVINRLHAAGIPVIQFDRYDPAVEAPFVGIDNFHAGFCMTEKLILSGHKNIALIVPEHAVFIIRERQRGYEAAMKHYKLESSVFTYDSSQSWSIYHQFDLIASSDKKFTAIFTPGGDVDAIECIRSARKLRITVPADLSIAGFDDISLASVIDPPLTTVCQPKYEIGVAAMNLLHELMCDSEPENKNVILPFECIVRESTRIIG